MELSDLSPRKSFTEKRNFSDKDIFEEWNEKKRVRFCLEINQNQEQHNMIEDQKQHMDNMSNSNTMVVEYVDESKKSGKLDTLLTNEQYTLNVDMELERARKRHFMFSRIEENEMKTLENVVSKLTGSISHLQEHFDRYATHIIIGKVSISLKPVCSTAAGLWLLHPSYLEKSMINRQWLPEEKFEWGNIECGFINEEGSPEAKLVIAARRLRLQGDGWQPFSGMAAKLLMSANREASFRVLIEAGGGRVIASGEPYSNYMTHLFVEPKNPSKPWSEEEVTLFRYN